MSVLNEAEIKKTKGRALHWGIIALLLIGIPFQLFPFFWMVSNSFKTSLEIIQIPPTLLPETWDFSGIVDTFTKYPLWENLWNTIVLCGGVILTQIPISAMAAFSLSKLKPKFSKTLLLFFLGTLMISSQALMFPTYIMLSDLPIIHVNLLNNYLAYILPSASWGYMIFLFKGFFDGLPNELMEAGKIDGAGAFRMFAQIIVPLSKPVFAVNILQTFMAVYNDFIMPLFVFPSDRLWTIMVRIYTAQNGSFATWNNIMVMLTVATIPILLLYFAVQKQLVQGISMTGLK
ncbi:carbohydrate ABC transporter permease [Cohnella sp. WQ 127256]|uniref:carbohydrate ABC transporter permease n=1 Tax=Cohnella sp. WQ 127256 TaxID=2938790 RepID=UPI0021188E22